MRSILDFFFPLSCPGCGCFVETKGFCAQCWSSIDFITSPQCSLCGDPCAEGVSKVCRLCHQKTPLFNTHQSLFYYGPLSRKVVFSLKYGRQRHLADLFAHWLVPNALRHPVHVIVPVPLHPKKLAQRGFNQAALMADRLGKLTGIPVQKRALVRHLNTPSQGFFSHNQREEIVFGAFAVQQEWNQETSVLLVDDVYTTGATLNACVHALKESGVLHVHALTLAKVVA